MSEKTATYSTTSNHATVDAATVKEPRGTSLSDFLLHVSGALKQAVPGAHWVRAEVLKVDYRQHISLELGSYDSGTQKAKARALIWASNRAMISRFEQATGSALKPGFKILFLCTVQFHPEYGFSLTLQDIDPRFTLGDMAAKLQSIRDRLVQLGEIQRNQQLAVPKDFTRVAVIAPFEAAGLGDFKTEADRLQAYGLCQFDYFTAQFQGGDVVNSFVSAMSEAVSRHVSRTVQYDAVVIIRGGGDKAGLYQLNEIKIARTVCRCPVPVFVGIGHERDKTILDELASQRFPTPSLVISHILSTVVKNARDARLQFEQLLTRAKSLSAFAKQELTQTQNQIQYAAQKQLALSKQHTARFSQLVEHESLRAVNNVKHIVAEQRQCLISRAQLGLNTAKSQAKAQHEKLKSNARKQQTSASNQLLTERNQLAFVAKQKVHDAKSLIGQHRQNLIQNAKGEVSNARHAVKILIERVLFQDPNKILARGFSLVKDQKGNPITRKVDLKHGQKVTIQFNDGEARASVED